MFKFNRRAVRAVVFSVAVAVSLTGCLSPRMYVDPALPKVVKADVPPPQTLHPVQVLFEFRTHGNANARATAEIKPRVVAVAAESGLFSGVSSTPATDGGVLKITIDNVEVDKNAAARGFGTGLTLGLVGTMVTDGYVADAAYTRDGKTTEVEVKHAIHTTIGNKSGPEGLQPMEPQAAVHQVMDQITWNALKQLSDRHAFD